MLNINLTLSTLLCIIWGLEAKPYDENLAKKILPLASAAYGADPIPCLNRTYTNVEMVKIYEPKCDATKEDTCLGYLALIHSEKVIAVVFRGTSTYQQLNIEQLATILDKQDFAGMGKVNKYFFDAFFAVWKSGMGTEFEQLIKKYPDYKLWVTGHSLGAAISSLASAHIMKYYTKFTMDNSAHYNYGQPRIGDPEFVASYNKLIPDFYRITHSQDTITVSPPIVFGFVHHATEVWYNNSMEKGSPYVFCKGDTDYKCSGPERDNWCDHRNYFGIKVTEYGGLGCKIPIA